VPTVLTVPTPGEIAAEVQFEVTHESVENEPLETEVGLAVNEVMVQALVKTREASGV